VSVGETEEGEGSFHRLRRIEIEERGFRIRSNRKDSPVEVEYIPPVENSTLGESRLGGSI
jgi:hypothetical protein